MKKEIYLAGGCFWGMQAYFEQIKGVVTTCVGYANGGKENPTYEIVCQGNTGFVETIRVVYNDQIVSLPCLLSAYYDVIDPTSIHRQGGDVGSQYRTGIYYVDGVDKDTIESSLNDLQKQYEAKIAVECKPLENFYEAETYHQDYLRKNPNGYCHISKNKIQEASQKEVY